MTKTLTLNIADTKYEAKASFAFIKVTEALGDFNEKTAKYAGGLETLLTSLVQFDAESLVDFWVAATAHYNKKERPSQIQVEQAIEDAVENGAELEDLLKDAYQFMSNSGFFKRKVTTFWEQFEMAKTMGKTDEEKEQNLAMYNHMQKLKEQIEA